MKNIQIFARKPSATKARNRRAGFLAMGLIIAVLVAAGGGGAKPPVQSSVIQAASPGNVAGQSDKAGQGGVRGDSEFGLPEAEVAKRVDAVESVIAICMTDAGFEYIPVDYATARAAMDSNSKPSGLNADEFRAQFGYGVAAQFAGTGSQAMMGAGAQNLRIRDGLSAADLAAHNHALYGENPTATFAVGLDDENFAQTGGCARAAVEKVFSPEELGPGFVNYQNAEGARIDQDLRVIAAHKDWATCMRAAGYSYDNSDAIKTDLANRLEAITGGAAPDQAEVWALANQRHGAAEQGSRDLRRLAISDGAPTNLGAPTASLSRFRSGSHVGNLQTLALQLPHVGVPSRTPASMPTPEPG